MIVCVVNESFVGLNITKIAVIHGDLRGASVIIPLDAYRSNSIINYS